MLSKVLAFSQRRRFQQISRNHSFRKAMDSDEAWPIKNHHSRRRSRIFEVGTFNMQKGKKNLKYWKKIAKWFYSGFKLRKERQTDNPADMCRANRSFGLIRNLRSILWVHLSPKKRILIDKRSDFESNLLLKAHHWNWYLEGLNKAAPSDCQCLR